MSTKEQKVKVFKIMALAVDYYEEMSDKASIDKHRLDDKEMTLLIHTLRQVNLSWLKKQGYNNAHELDRVTEALALDMMDIMERELAKKKRSKNETD